MDESESTPTRFYVEHLRRVGLGVEDGWSDAWVPVGHIDWDGDQYRYRDAFTAWVGEQDPEPPFGTYRLIRSESYAWSFAQFEVREHRERVIEQVEHPQLARDIETLSKAALSSAPGVE